MITYHRNTFTPWEIKFGECATHYKDFDREQVEIFIVGAKRTFSDYQEALDFAKRLQDKTGVIVGITSHFKKWIKCPYDGLRYYR